MVHSPTQPRFQVAEPQGRRTTKARDLFRLSEVDRPSLRVVPDVESGSLLSTMAHEIRGPLSAVALSSELLLHDLDALRPEQVRSLAQRIHRGTLWLQGLLDNITCDAAIREDRFQLDLKPLDVLEVAREIEGLLEPLMSSRGQELRLEIHSMVPTVMADRRRLGQVLVNLLLNASKFASNGTPVVLTVTPTDSAIRISVADRGCGLDTDAMTLFERFYRSENARQAGIVGTGLGLAIVKAIVDAHGGVVGAENRRFGGARFWFEIPIAAA